MVVSEDHTARGGLREPLVRTSARHEPPGQTGFAHLFEHLMFEGSAHVAKTWSTVRLVSVQGSGGSLNADHQPGPHELLRDVAVRHLELGPSGWRHATAWAAVRR
ncbi:hypothetical protein GCM10020358_26410 [Amorphoplanes nipponensis]|uniref:insulinase family protein n=1 Tax=Actinoplanes nipponensis TaxID=135950 RepID=UPI0031EA5B42